MNMDMLKKTNVQIGIAVAVFLIILIVFLVARANNNPSQEADGTPEISEAQKRVNSLSDELATGVFNRSNFSNIREREITDLSVLTDRELYGDAKIGDLIVTTAQGIIVYDPVADQVVGFRLKPAPTPTPTPEVMEDDENMDESEEDGGGLFNLFGGDSDNEENNEASTEDPNVDPTEETTTEEVTPEQVEEEPTAEPTEEIVVEEEGGENGGAEDNTTGPITE